MAGHGSTKSVKGSPHERAWENMVLAGSIAKAVPTRRRARTPWNEEARARLLPAAWPPQGTLQPLSGALWPLSGAPQPRSGPSLAANAAVSEKGTYDLEKTGFRLESWKKFALSHANLYNKRLQKDLRWKPSQSLAFDHSKTSHTSRPKRLHSVRREIAFISNFLGSANRDRCSHSWVRHGHHQAPIMVSATPGADVPGQCTELTRERGVWGLRPACWMAERSRCGDRIHRSWHPKNPRIL